ncbi:protein-L-isoaspartate O-methyltransferase family protein [Streptomyces sp. NPDC002306]
MQTAYADQTLVTRVGPTHADHAHLGEAIGSGRTSSSSTQPSLVVTMYRHAALGDDSRTLVTTGTGYGTALLCRRLGEKLVTSVDVDPYLVESATDRLDALGLHPDTAVVDLTGPLPGQYDRIVATVSVRRIPASWLNALRSGGRLVTTISNTGLILVADKTGSVNDMSPMRSRSVLQRTTSGSTYVGSWGVHKTVLVKAGVHTRRPGRHALTGGRHRVTIDEARHVVRPSIYASPVPGVLVD